MTICTQLDDFMVDYIERKARWEVKLNNGEKIYQDDGRPGVQPYSAWRRLRKYCEENQLYIIEMLFGFRSNTYSLPSNADGYFFSHGSRGCFGSTRTIFLFHVGVLQNGILNVTCWKTPEMLKENTECRDITKVGECLIQKNMLQFMEPKDQ